MRRSRRFDNALSALVLVAYGVIWLIQFIMAKVGVNAGVQHGIGIAKDVMLVFTYFILLYNALGWKRGFIYRLIVIVVAGFMMFCVVAPYIPNLNVSYFPI